MGENVMVDYRTQNLCNNFGIELLKRLHKKKPFYNQLISAYGLFSVLIPLLNGATGENYNEIKKTLQIAGLSTDRINRYVQILDNKLEASAEIANAILVDKRLPLSNDYIKNISSVFSNLKLKNVNFSQDIADEINAWVAQKTHNKIKEIIKETDALTALIIINAIYFKQAWENEFDTRKTSLQDFNLADGSTKQVPTMTNTEDFGYYEDDVFTVVELPYENKINSMYIYLPKFQHTIDDVLEAMTIDHDIPLYCKPLSVKLHMPKFTGEYCMNTDLENALQDMGMVRAFHYGGFDLMTGCSNEIFVSNIVQKTFIDVNEEGTEAAAATMVECERGIHIPNKVVKVNRSFVYTIMDKTTRTNLFTGIMYNPDSN